MIREAINKVEVSDQGELLSAIGGSIVTSVNSKVGSVNLGFADIPGVVPPEKLPSYVDDIIEYSDYNTLTGTIGESGKIYLITGDNAQKNYSYRWASNGYFRINATPEEVVLLTGNQKISGIKSFVSEIAGSNDFTFSMPLQNLGDNPARGMKIIGGDFTGSKYFGEHVFISGGRGNSIGGHIVFKAGHGAALSGEVAGWGDFFRFNGIPIIDMYGRVIAPDVFTNRKDIIGGIPVDNRMTLNILNTGRGNIFGGEVVLSGGAGATGSVGAQIGGPIRFIAGSGRAASGFFQFLGESIDFNDSSFTIQSDGSVICKSISSNEKSVFNNGIEVNNGSIVFNNRPTVNGIGVILSGDSDYYKSNNPSGFITGVDLSDYVTTSQTGNFVTNSQIGNFYPASNPSGFITGVNLSAYVETGTLFDELKFKYPSSPYIKIWSSTLPSYAQGIYKFVKVGDNLYPEYALDNTTLKYNSELSMWEIEHSTMGLLAKNTEDHKDPTLITGQWYDSAAPFGGSPESVEIERLPGIVQPDVNPLYYHYTITDPLNLEAGYNNVTVSFGGYDFYNGGRPTYVDYEGKYSISWAPYINQWEIKYIGSGSVETILHSPTNSFYPPLNDWRSGIDPYFSLVELTPKISAPIDVVHSINSKKGNIIFSAVDVGAVSLTGDQNISGQLISYLSNGNIQIPLGFSNYAYVRNLDSALTKGEVVYIAGAQGDRAAVRKASNTGEATSSKTFGIAAEAIASGDDGYVINNGQLQNLNILTGFNVGDSIWLGSGAGTLTNIKPQAPQHAVFLGVVEKPGNGNNGIMYVKVQNGYELNEIHDVLINSPSSSQVLYRDGDNLWKNKNLTTSDVSGVFHALNFWHSSMSLSQSGLHYFSNIILGTSFDKTNRFLTIVEDSTAKKVSWSHYVGNTGDRLVTGSGYFINLTKDTTGIINLPIVATTQGRLFNITGEIQPNIPVSAGDKVNILWSTQKSSEFITAPSNIYNSVDVYFYNK